MKPWEVSDSALCNGDCIPKESESLLDMRLGILEGAILYYLEEELEVSLLELSLQLRADYTLVAMAVGALVRQELVDARNRETHLVLKPKNVRWRHERFRFATRSFE